MTALDRSNKVSNISNGCMELLEFGRVDVAGMEIKDPKWFPANYRTSNELSWRASSYWSGAHWGILMIIIIGSGIQSWWNRELDGIRDLEVERSGL